MKWVFYVDMDAFYVSCELRGRPDLVGRATIVGPDPKRGPTRGVVLSASYEARKFGVRSAMPVSQADRLCPDAVWIPADFPKYEQASRDVLARLRGFASDVRAHSIDEAALTLEAEGVVEAERLGRAIQLDLVQATGLPSTIGVGPNRLVAKIATDQAKPAGVRVVSPEGVATFLAPLPVRVVPGVGPKTGERLKSAGIETLGQLAAAPRGKLQEVLGGWSDELRRLARGEYADPPEEDTGPRSRSAEETFEEDLTRIEALEEVARRLARHLASALAEERFRYQTVTVALRWADFSRVQRSRTLPSAREGPGDLEGTAVRLLHELWNLELGGRHRPARMLSVGAERLIPARLRSIPLEQFDPAQGTIK
ncbi:MAG TPA: DNA polymerase IV [Thermoplasmata archaeon]|nr:DNA polymerase IV [Thermoplasmata archaeon]